MSEGDWASASAPGKRPQIDSIFDFTSEALGELKTWLEQSGLIVPATSIGSGSIAYVPTWTSSGVAPAIGNSTYTLARYTRVGRTMIVTVILNFGNTATYGTGNYYFTLPIEAPYGYDNAIVGSFQAYDASANSVWTGTAQITTGGVGTANNKLQFLYTGAAGAFTVGAAAPFTFATTDQLKFSVVYESIT